MSGLDGVGVLVTRPEHQAAALCRLLESHGARVFRWPVIRIEPVGELHEVAAALNPAEPFDLIIFTSANAVRFGAPLLATDSSPALAAIGPATARALARVGLGAALTPADNFDSEGLLAHPALAAPGRRRVLIIKGTGGREVLQDRLTLQGAQVVVAHVYERVPVDPDPSALAALETTVAAHDIDIITATSAEIAARVLDLATPTLRRGLDLVRWLVPGVRVATELRERGLLAPMLLAESAQDQDLVTALLRWRAGESGA
jgi:uroporphyrinogen-III synthase